MDKIILDTSVIVKWFVDEPKSSQALELLELQKKKKINILVPEIIILELINALFFSAHFNKNELKDTLNHFYNYNLKIINIKNSTLLSATSIMTNFSITSYDALFIALAQELNCPLITNDRKHHLEKMYRKIEYL